MPEVTSIPIRDASRRRGHATVAVRQDLTGVVTLTAVNAGFHGETRIYEFPAGEWMVLTAPAAQVLALIRDLASTRDDAPADDAAIDLAALAARARALRSGLMWADPPR